MLSKVMIGVTAAMGLALAIVFSLLLSSKEANGVLIQGIESARGVNDRQAKTLIEVRANHDNLLVQIEKERVKSKKATDDLEQVRGDLTLAKVDFDQRIKDAVAGLSDEELECASEFVPAALIDSMWDDEAGSPN